MKYVNTELIDIEDNGSKFIICQFTLEQVGCWLSRPDLISFARIHGIYMSKSVSRAQIDDAIVDHICDSCLRHVCIFEEMECKADRQKKYRAKASKKICSLNDKYQLNDVEDNYSSKEFPASNDVPKFPPTPSSRSHIENIINGFCKDSDSTSFEEAGCAVCGQLCPLSALVLLSEFCHSLDILAVPDVTRRERHSAKDAIKGIEGPVLDTCCKHICPPCSSSIVLDLEISTENLASYPLNGVPVEIDYMKRDSENRVPSAMSVHDTEEEEGSSEG
ncbi:hypothetical protein BJ912DRAFT_854688, partial [Pholiota molesta]